MNNRLELKLYKAYLFFLPLGYFLRYDLPLQSYLFNIFSCFFFWPGLFLMFFNKRKKHIPPLLRGWQRMTWFQSIYTFAMALILFIPLGPLYGENTLRACIGMIIFGIVVLLHISYNVYAFTHLITWGQAERIFRKSIYVLLFVGYLQLASLRIGGLFTALYRALGSVLFLSEDLERGVQFFGSEASSVATLFLFIIPYLIAKVLHSNFFNVWKNKDLLLLVLFIPLFITSNSSSVLMSIAMVLAVTICMILRYRGFYKACLIGSLLAGLSVAVAYGLGDMKFQGKTTNQESLEYILLGKITDTENYSTMMRSSTIINDMRIFFKFPITGVGDGLQGYWYNEHLPIIYLASSEIQDIVSGKNGIIDGGGAYFPIMLSAYGLIGITCLFVFLGGYKKYIIPQKHEKNVPIPIIMFRIFFCIFLSSAWFGLGIRQNFLVCFVLSLPIIYQATLMKNKRMEVGGHGE